MVYLYKDAKMQQNQTSNIRNLGLTGVKTCECFLCFVAIVRVRMYYVEFFICVFFFVLLHWWVSLTSLVLTPRMSQKINVFSSVSKVAESSICTVRDFNWNRINMKKKKCFLKELQNDCEKLKIYSVQPWVLLLSSPPTPPPSTLLGREISDPKNNRFEGLEYRTSS